MPVEGDYACYSKDWRRTDPDLVLHLPTRVPEHPEHQDHVLVDYTPGGDLLAIWTLAYEPDARDYGVYFAHSTDHGHTWTEPAQIHEAGTAGQVSSFGFPVITSSGRIYCYYNRSVGYGENALNAVLRCRYSDDDGHTWIDGGVDIEYRRTPIDHPDPTVPPMGIVWQKPIRDAKGRHVVALTRWAAQYITPKPYVPHMGDRPNGMFREFRCEFLRFDNIDDGPDPKDVQITWLPEDENLIQVPVSFEPQASDGYTFCEEPGLVLLPDGRLFAEMRTANGELWYTVSDDAEALTWRPTEILRFRDGGEPMLNPNSPSPMYRMETDATCCSSRITTAGAMAARDRWRWRAAARSSWPLASTVRTPISRCGSASRCCCLTRRRWASFRSICGGCRCIPASPSATDAASFGTRTASSSRWASTSPTRCWRR